MSHVLTTAPDALAPFGTNAAIEQRFTAMADPHRPRTPRLLVVAADLSAAQIGAYAGEAVDTPHLDRLAKSGARFTQLATSPAPPPMSLLLAPLAEGGYDTGRFADVDRAVSFVGLRRKVPWAAYVELGAADCDAGVGALMAALRRGDHYRKTVVLVLGAHTPNAPALLAWPGQIPPRQRFDTPIARADWLPTLLEVCRPGSSRHLDHEGVDLSGHLLDGDEVPARARRTVGARAA